jgi:hypothetical protein
MGLLEAPVSAFKNSVPGGVIFPAIGSVSREYWSLWDGESARLNSSWLQSEGFKLSPPLRGRIAKSLDAETAGQATLDRCPDQIWRKERKRDRHIDLAHAAPLTSGDLLNVGYPMPRATPSYRSMVVKPRRQIRSRFRAGLGRRQHDGASSMLTGWAWRVRVKANRCAVSQRPKQGVAEVEKSAQ